MWWIRDHIDRLNRLFSINNRRSCICSIENKLHANVNKMSENSSHLSICSSQHIYRYTRLVKCADSYYYRVSVIRTRKSESPQSIEKGSRVERLLRHRSLLVSCSPPNSDQIQVQRSLRSRVRFNKRSSIGECVLSSRRWPFFETPLQSSRWGIWCASVSSYLIRRSDG